MDARPFYKYHLKNGKNRTILRDVTTNLERAQEEHRATYGSDHSIVRIGIRVTEKRAQEWLKRGGRKGPPRKHKNDKQATRAELKGEVERLTKSEAVLAQENKDLVRETEKVIAEANRLQANPVPLRKIGESGSPWWLYQWHRIVTLLKNDHPEGCSIDRFADPKGRYFDHWNCKRTNTTRE